MSNLFTWCSSNPRRFLRTYLNFRGTYVCLRSEFVPGLAGYRLKLDVFSRCVRATVLYSRAYRPCPVALEGVMWNSCLLYKEVLTYKRRIKLSVKKLVRQAVMQHRCLMSVIMLDSPSKSFEVKSRHRVTFLYICIFKTPFKSHSNRGLSKSLVLTIFLSYMPICILQYFLTGLYCWAHSRTRQAWRLVCTGIHLHLVTFLKSKTVGMSRQKK